MSKIPVIKRKEELENTDTSLKPAGSKRFVFDPSIDPDNPDVVEFKTLNITPESGFGQRYGITKPYTTETETEIEGSFREMLNKYSSLTDDIEAQDAYMNQLEKNLTPEEMIIFRAHLQQAMKLGL